MRDRNIAASFSEQVYARLARGELRGRMLEHARTPAVLRILGFPSLPLAMTPGVLSKIASGKNGGRAPLTLRQIATLPELLDEAAAVFLQEDGSSVIVLSTECDSDDKPIVICVRPDVRDGVRFVNLIATAFGKDNAESWAARHMHALRYAGEKTNPRLPLPGLIYHQTGARETEGSRRKILGPEDLRKFKAAARVALPLRNIPQTR
ncbi:hypothetical protein [Noviluteimonas gilva]|uniref:Phage MuF C-terminal domain-containing protein n=1 Tax=Noviluteimonas gilva TaxID=2682097 RepID=A0A7C9HUV0_9GAMM|nr:hypothetical protein [Lysobacter gilvus]MUV13898.1 hypothetical protein [Lysobacter gilvus]